MPTGRFAPSPTGPLHLGNLRTALLAWLFARSSGGRFVMRVEDLATEATGDHERGQLGDLAAIGIDWDEPVVRQSERLSIYNDALHDLEQAGQTYRCWCSRREIRESVAAPHHPPGTYPGTCRTLSTAQIAAHEASNRQPALRLRAEVEELTIHDRVQGTHTGTVDDVVLRRGDQTPAYNFVVVLDDAAQGVGEVVRGSDLLDSTPRQAHLIDRLALQRPAWAHVPLVLNDDGSRLAKRDGAVTLTDRLSIGDSVERVVGRLAESAGLVGPESTLRADELLGLVDPAALPKTLRRDPWVTTPTERDSPW